MFSYFSLGLTIFCGILFILYIFSVENVANLGRYKKETFSRSKVIFTDLPPVWAPVHRLFQVTNFNVLLFSHILKEHLY